MAAPPTFPQRVGLGRRLGGNHLWTLRNSRPKPPKAFCPPKDVKVKKKKSYTVAFISQLRGRRTAIYWPSHAACAGQNTDQITSLAESGPCRPGSIYLWLVDTPSSGPKKLWSFRATALRIHTYVFAVHFFNWSRLGKMPFYVHAPPSVPQVHLLTKPRFPHHTDRPKQRLHARCAYYAYSFSQDPSMPHVAFTVVTIFPSIRSLHPPGQCRRAWPHGAAPISENLPCP